MSAEHDFKSDLARFVQAVEVCGCSGHIVPEAQAAARLRDTLATASDEHPSVMVLLANESQVSLALAHARRFGLSVHPVSSGHNWGYGTIRPASASTRVIFDLSAMNRIVEFDAELGVVVVEPGVTQGQLEAFLGESGCPFMVPTTGAGPSCSLVGNALERGYGMTPVADHFQAVLGLSALLPDGTRYSSPLWCDDSGGKVRVPIYRWGVGPYVDGLFAQNGGAIVTRMALQLMPRPPHIEMFVFWVHEDNELERTIDAVRGLLTRSGLVIGGINLMNAARVASVAGSGATNGAAWIGTGVLYGERHVIRAGRKVICDALRPVASRLAFFNAARIRVMEALAGVPLLGHRIANMVRSVRSAYDMLSGHPGEFALALAYGENRNALPAGDRDPARDGCGLLWYAPLVPMSGEAARTYVQMVERVCGEHGFASPITFSTLSVACFDSTVPLIFHRDDQNSARALGCLRSLINEGRSHGFHPYRFHSALMGEACQDADGYWHLADKIRAAIDPEGLIAPGRYERRRLDLLQVPDIEEASA